MSAAMKTCPDCNTENTINAKFCTACGTKLEENSNPLELIEPLSSTPIQIVDQVLVSEKIPGLKIRTHVLFFAYCESIWDLLRNFLVRKPEANTRKSEKISQLKSDSLLQVLNVDSETLQEPKISKLIWIKAYYERVQTLVRNKLQRIKNLRFKKTKTNPVEVADSVMALESAGESDGSKVKRILIVAGVAGITAVAASVGISWFMNDASQNVSAATKVSSPTIVAPQNPAQPVIPSPVISPATEAVQSKPTVTATPSPNVGIQSSAPSNSLANQPADTVQPVIKKQTTNQQDVNRKRLLELKRQLGQ